MTISERNRKVAIARWENIRSNERANISNDADSKYFKAVVCGFLAGDGSVQRRQEKGFFHHQIDFFPDDKIMLDMYCQSIKYLYNKEPSIKKRNNLYYVRLSSKTIHDDLTGIANFGLYKWRVPFSLLSSCREKVAWLKAFFSAEGHVNNNAIRVQTVNKNGMLEVSKLLNEIGISHKYYEYLPKNCESSKVSIINIGRKEARKSFSISVGFWHSKKTKILNRALAL